MTSISTTTSTEERVIELLGQGIPAEMVASAIGISPSRVSQLLSTPSISERVSNLRYQNLAKHTSRDNKYDGIEDKLLDKLENTIPFMIKSQEILRAVQVINGAKRRASSAPESILQQQEVVSINMPVQIYNKVVVNINNQVIKAGAQDLITVQSASMNQLLENKKGGENVQTTDT